MTNIEAIKAKLNYPLSDNSFTVALQDRGLTDSDTYSTCQAFDLAYADVINTLVTAPDTKEGGFTLTLTDKDKLLRLADGIYKTYSQPNPIANGSMKARATFVQLF
jgi:hypothetical protein